MRQFNVEPTCIHGTIETVDGLELDSLSASPNPFKSLSILADQICSDYNIEHILRSGLRFFYFNKLSKIDGDIFKVYSQMFNPHILNELQPNLGTIEDYGIVFDGSLDADLKYHFRTGPYRSQESEKYLTVTAKKFSEHADFDMICDIDFYETNFSLSARQLLQVYRPIIAHIKALVRSTENEVIKLLEAV